MTGHGPRHLAARIGSWSARHRKLAIGGWLAFVAVSLVLGAAVGTKELSDVEGGTGESGRAERILADAGFAETDSELVLIQGTRSTRGLERAISEVRQALRHTPGVTSIEDVERSDDRRTALVPFEYGGSEIDEPLAAVERVQRANPGLYIAELGERSAEKAVDETVGADLRRAEYFSIPLTLAILIIAFGSIIAATVPLLVALTAVVSALGLLSVVSQVAPADDAASSVILLIGLAVGVDYSLFYLRREREERATGKNPSAALDAAAATSGHAVLVSGLTVLIAMAGMLVSGSREIASVGVGAMLVVTVALVGSLTVLPAVLSALGDRVERGRIPLLRRRRARVRAGSWDALVGRVLRRPGWAALIAAAPLVALSAVALGLQTVNPGLSSLPQKLSVVETYKRLEKAFPGDSEPATVVVRTNDIDTPRVLGALESVERQSDVIDVDVNPARTVAVVHVSLPGNGTDAAAVRGLARVRSIVARTLGEVPGVEVAVTGTTAESTDFNELLKERAPLVFAFVLGLSFLLLLLAFRSLVVAAKAVLLNLLSVGAAYGLLVVVFQHGLGESLLDFESNGGVVAWLPLFLFIVLFGLSMDYHVFILSRVRESVDRGESTEGAIARAITSTAGTVTSAAVVMVAVFAIFATLSSLEMKQLGVGLASAILIDATIVRAVLLPATMKLLGDWNWYLPTWLEWLPSLGADRYGKGYSVQRSAPENA